MLSIQKQVSAFIENNPNAEYDATIAFFKTKGFKENTVKSAIRRWRLSKKKDASKSAKKKSRKVNGQYGKPNFQATSTVSRISNFKPVTFKNKKEAEKDFVVFVGFRGYFDKKVIL